MLNSDKFESFQGKRDLVARTLCVFLLSDVVQQDFTELLTPFNENSVFGVQLQFHADLIDALLNEDRKQTREPLESTHVSAVRSGVNGHQLP